MKKTMLVALLLCLLTPLAKSRAEGDTFDPCGVQVLVSQQHEILVVVPCMSTETMAYLLSTLALPNRRLEHKMKVGLHGDMTLTVTNRRMNRAQP